LSQAGQSVRSSSILDSINSATPFFSGQQIAHWHAVYTTPRHEKRVHESLVQRQLDCFLPLYRTVHRWKNGCKATVELPLFPGYLFTKVSKNERVRVLEVPGVLSFVGNKTGASEISDLEIETLRSGLHLQKFEPHRHLAIGEKVRITAGPLSGLVGVLLRNANSFRVVLTLELIQQSVAVELDAADVEPLRSQASFGSNLAKQN
jgi:transcription antitermination factor NusG